MKKLIEEELIIIKNISCYWDSPNDSIIHSIFNHWLGYNPNYTTQLINLAEIHQFLCDYKFNFLSNNFFKFNVYCVRADIARIVQLFLYGGFYADSHIGFKSSLDNIQFDDNYNPHNKHSSCYMHPIGLIYSQPHQSLLLDCLNCMNIQIERLLKSNKTKAGEYTKQIYMACGNGLYFYFNKKCDLVKFNQGRKQSKIDMIQTDELLEYFRLFKNNESIYKFWGNKNIFNHKFNTRNGNKHWTTLSSEIDLI